MSLAPLVHPAIRGVEGRSRPVNNHCAAPGCISISQQRHHLWPKSYLRGQPLEWVSLPSGRVVQNTTGLCMRHHEQVTGGIGGHQAQIHLEPDETFIWLTPNGDGGWVNEGFLHPQPWSEDGPIVPVDPEVKKAVKSQAHMHPDLKEGETCSACGYTRPTPRENMPKRESKTYTMLVPNDAEVGADVVDEWVQQLAVILGFGDDVGKRLVRYHTIVAALAWTMMNRQQFIKDIKEAAST